MARETFIDSSGFFALLCADDASHQAAQAWLDELRASSGSAVTTDYILDETATLLKARGGGHRLAQFFQFVTNSNAIRIEWMHSARFTKATEFLLRHADHGYSFTDCVSFVVMRELRLTESLTTDKHFPEAGFRALLRA
jgi:predicted nucleic acid-binding protein